MNESARLLELDRLCLLSPDPDPQFDAITRVAAALFGVPMACVSIVGEEHLCYRTTEAQQLRENTRVGSFCSHAIEVPERVLVVPDAARDPRFANHPLVIAEPHVRFYAGAPLRSSRGFALGTLCILDTQPRTFHAHEAALLQTLARITIEIIESRPTSAARPGSSSAGIERRTSLFESALIHASDAIMIVESTAVDGPAGTVAYVNDAFTRMTGYTADDIVGATAQLLAGPQTDRAQSARIAHALRHQEPLSVELATYRKDGSPMWVEWNVSPVTGAEGNCLYYLVVQRDLTERRALERYEDDRAVVLEMAIRNAPLATQLNRIVLLLRDVVPGSMGTTLLLEGDRLVTGAADPRIPAELFAGIENAAIGPDAGSCGTAVFTKTTVISGDIANDARWVPYAEPALAHGLRACWSVPLFSAAGNVIGAFALYLDRPANPTPAQQKLLEETARFASLVIDRHHDQARLERLATRDSLTDLPNRLQIEQTVQAATREAERSGALVAVGILALNRFKGVNDAFGHHMGDRLLQHIASRLAGSLRAGDAVGRAGGDEFVVVFPNLADADEGVAAATRLQQVFSESFVIEGVEFFVQTSMGLAFYPETSTETSGLFQGADRAMFFAKSRGGGLELAAPASVTHAVRAIDLESDLQYALARNEFTLNYQSIFDLHDGRPVGAEALLRWQHPRLGLVGPSDFIPLAEANRTIVPIGTWVIEQAVATARRWQAAGRDAFVTVNVSALQFDTPGLLETVTESLARSGLEPERLHLELTESLLMRNPAACAATMLALKTLGVKIIIDDFGTGYSSLAYLQRFPFDTLKIDQSFVRGVGDETASERSENIVGAVITIAQALEVLSVAEGVENAWQYDFIRGSGCTMVQGFLCARPVAETELRWSAFTSAARSG